MGRLFYASGVKRSQPLTAYCMFLGGGLGDNNIMYFSIMTQVALRYIDLNR
jgi:hypothetical protein